MADLLQFPAPDQLSLFHLPPQPTSSDLPDTLALEDPAARQAALDTRQSWIVEAPAGSGKTALLIQRLLKLLAYGEVSRPREILAITFTRKAAAELRNRVLEQLTEASQKGPPSASLASFERETRELALAVLARDRALGWHLLESPHELNIRTIDSFCSELAAGVPLLSGGTGRRQPTDDPAPLYELAAERTLRQLGTTDPVLNHALRSLLLHRDGQMGDCIRLIAHMLAHREQWGELVPLESSQLTEEALDQQVKHRLERTLEHVVSAGLARAAQALPPGALDDLARFAARLATEPSSNDRPSPLALCAGLAQPPGTTAGHLDHWQALLGLLLTSEGKWRSGFNRNHLQFAIGAEDKIWLKDFVARLQAQGDLDPELRNTLCDVTRLPEPRYPDEQWRVAKALFRVLRHALAELAVLFDERAVTDFTEVALTARRLLRFEPDLLSVPAAQLTHLLVDEMQDTSVGQYQLFELLTRGWDGHTQTVFLVGDPKQSIYGFRQASVERFLRTQAARRLDDIPLGALRLTANFRSQAELVAEFNTTFEQILPCPDQVRRSPFTAPQVPFVAATARRKPDVSPALHWHAAFTPYISSTPEVSTTPGPPTTTADGEARALRQTIEAFTARWNARPLAAEKPPRAPRIAVLARGRAHLAPIIAEFHRDHGHGTLPFRAVDVERLDERPEVLDLLALTRALLHPGDRVAWLAVLHSPVCGLGLADLLALTGEGSDAQATATVLHLVETRSGHLSPDGQARLRKAWRVLSEAQASLGRTPLSTHVERTWRSLGADLLLRPDQHTNAHRFFGLLQHLESGADPLSLDLLQRRMRHLYAEPIAAPDAVELMTIHKAKGLEWDLVLVPGLGRGTPANTSGLLRWLELDDEDLSDAGIILAPVQSKGEGPSTLSAWLGNLQRAREKAEAKRLFYVACTRAREELHLFATCETRAGELVRPLEGSLLAASWGAAEAIFARQLAAQTPIPTPEASSAQLITFPGPQAISGLSLAAAGTDEPPLTSPAGPTPRKRTLPCLPLSVDPSARFLADAGPRLPYAPAASLRHTAAFERPEGSFTARAFGNVVHRFLDLCAQRLSAGLSPQHLLAELPSWRPRLLTTLRAEGVPTAIGTREADRALDFLLSTLNDPTGRWLLSGHPGAQSEKSLRSLGSGTDAAPGANVRADRVFLAGPDPFADNPASPSSHLWIVDFKTAEPGGRDPHTFLAAEREKYEPQMNAYARASALAAQEHKRPIVLALYYPSITQMLHWLHEPEARLNT